MLHAVKAPTNIGRGPAARLTKQLLCRHHAEGLAAAIEAERVAAEARVLSPRPESVPAPDGTLVAPGQAAG